MTTFFHSDKIASGTQQDWDFEERQVIVLPHRAPERCVVIALHPPDERHPSGYAETSTPLRRTIRRLTTDHSRMVRGALANMERSAFCRGRSPTDIARHTLAELRRNRCVTQVDEIYSCGAAVKAVTPQGTFYLVDAADLDDCDPDAGECAKVVRDIAEENGLRCVGDRARRRR